MKNVISIMFFVFNDQFLNQSENMFKNIKLKFAKKVANATTFLNVKIKIYYNIKHKSLLLKI